MSDFLCADWLTAMVNTSTDHENNVMVVQILFLHAWLSQWGQRKWPQKMSTAMLLKKQITSRYPWSILLKRLLKWHQNVQNFAVKPFTCSSIVDKSTVWPWKTVDGLLNHVEMYSTSQREANCAVYPLKRNLSRGYWYPALKHLALVVQMLDSMNTIHWIKKYLSNR